MRRAWSDVPKRAHARRLFRRLALLAASIALTLPMLLGPATTPLLRALAGEARHLCMCGMQAGKCGCPECERLEQARQDARRPVAVPSLRSSCDSDDAPIAPSPPLPPAILPLLARTPAPAEARAPHVLELTRLRSRATQRPETPPPRSIVVS